MLRAGRCLGSGIAAVALALTLLPAVAQAATGRTRVEGKVTDPQGKPIADVVIKIINTELAIKTTQIKSKANGAFVHPLVEIGSYKIIPEKAGLKIISYKVRNENSGKTDIGSYGPVTFDAAQEPRTMALKSGGLCQLEIIMAPVADYQKLAVEAAKGGGALGGAAGTPGVSAERHPAEAGRDLFQAKDYTGALAMFEKALAQEGGQDDPDVHFALGRTYYELGRYDEATAELDRVIELEPQPRVGLFYTQALIAHKQGRVTEAIDMLMREEGAAGSADPRLLSTLGSLLRDAGRKEEAISTLERAAELDPKNLNTLMALGSLYASKNDQGQAEIWFQRAAEAGAASGQDGAVVFFNLGALNANNGDWGNAVAAFERAVALRPDYANAHRELGYACRELGQQAKAREHLEAYLRLQPNAKDKPEVQAVVAGLGGR